VITFSKIFLATTLSTLLVACSNAPVQTKRLNTVEDLVVGAERVLSNNTNPNAKQYAKQNLDTAGAYLLTLRDNKNILSDNQLKRYNALTQRISVLQKQTN
jgi:hypothetical protein